MDDLFGISMDLIMWVLLALLALAVASVGFVAFRNRIMFKMGIRNIPRRRAQTTLIVLGLMLSTVIISAAFTTGDTVDRSITSQVYAILGSMDEVVHLGSDDDGSFDDPDQGNAREPTFPLASVASLIQTLEADPEVDAVIPAYQALAVAVNPEERLSSPLFNVLGLDPAKMRALPDIRDLGGARRTLDELGPGEIFLNESAAEELNVAAGDTIVVYARGRENSFRVEAVVEDKRLAGAGGISVRREGGVLPLEAAQQLFDEPGQLTMLVVSNQGDARAGVAHAESVEAKIEAALRSLDQGPGAPNLTVAPVKKTGVDIAEIGANIFTTFFLVLGLFSIGAGVLLIFMIFVMLAAERKPEMGMARAVGTKRMDLVQTFLAEGMAYNLLAAMVGTLLGVLVSFVMTRIMAAIFSEFDIEIAAHVTFRSLAIAYSLGVVLTFFTVTFSSWRVSYINIVRAIRDIPEPPAGKPLWGHRSFWAVLRDLFFRPTTRGGWLRRGATLVALILAGAGAGGAWPLLALAGLIAAGVLASFAWSQQALPWLFKLGVFLGELIAFPISLAAGFFMTFQLGPLFVVGGIPLLVLGAAEDNAFALLFGLSLLPLGLALVIRSFGANERITYTITGLLLIYVWEIDFSVGLIERIFGEAEGDIEMFFLSGVMVTIAATFLIVYNSDLILGPLTRVGKGLGALLPSLKMAVAYPLANRMRTGMTMAMFCLVVFALTMMSSMNFNFNRLFLSDRALGGWDVYVDENPSNPIADLRGELARAGSSAVGQIEAVGTVSFAGQRNGRICQATEDTDCDIDSPAKTTFHDYAVRGDDPEFLDNAQLPLQTRARGYDSDEAVWRAVAGSDRFAVIDSTAVTGDFAPPVIEGVEPGDSEMDPITVTVRDAASGRSGEVTIIGVIEMGASGNYPGLHMSEAGRQAIFGPPDTRRHYVKTAAGADNRAVAREIESVLLTTGAQAESLRYEADRLASTQNSFFYLMQGFMGLGLVVGVAAVGVIAFRTVVERRQQIGMLRAIGYTRGMIGLTFLLESSFIAFMGILSGVFFALILARQLISDEFANQGVSSFAVPWLQIAIIGGLAFGFALLMTLIPSRQAARIPIAAALRYE